MRTSINVSEEVLAQLKELKDKKGISYTALLQEMLHTYDLSKRFDKLEKSVEEIKEKLSEYELPFPS